MGRVRTALASLTAGQRWTASLAVALAFAVLVFGMPDQQAFSSAPTAASSRERSANPDASAATPADDVLPVPALLSDSTAPPFGDLTPVFPPPAPPPAETPPAPPAPEAPAPPAAPCPAPVALTGVAEIDAILCALFVLLAIR